jgi:hypothetical protein
VALVLNGGGELKERIGELALRAPGEIALGDRLRGDERSRRRALRHPFKDFAFAYGCGRAHEGEINERKWNVKSWGLETGMFCWWYG